MEKYKRDEKKIRKEMQREDESQHLKEATKAPARGWKAKKKLRGRRKMKKMKIREYEKN